MTSISGPGLSASFQYDALGRRVSKTINGVTTSYLYDGNDIVQEIGGSAVGASYVRSLNIDEPFVRQVASGNEFYHADALGSSLALSNAAGASTVSYSYEAFGKTTVTGTSSNPFQYTGRENDGTGLYYYRFRYYASRNDRFILEDPIGLAGGLNLYAYVDSNPVSKIDPLGLWPCGWDVYQKERNNFPSGPNDKYKHCIIGCLITQACGRLQGGLAGPGKELLDLVDFNPDTHVEIDDIYATQIGKECALSIRRQQKQQAPTCDQDSCQKCCKRNLKGRFAR